MKIDGTKLMEHREKADKSRSQLGRIAGITRVRVWQIEKVDLIVHLNINAVRAICLFLGITEEDIKA